MTFLALCACLGIWAFAFAFALNAPSIEAALFWRRVAAVGWSTVYSVMLHFFLVFTETQFLVRNGWTYLLVYLPAAVWVYVFSLSDSMATAHHNLVKTAWGWYNLGVNTGWGWAFSLYCLAAVSTSLGLTWHWGRRSAHARHKKQAALIASTVMAAFLIGFPTDIVLPVLGVAVIPGIAVIVALVPALGIWQAMRKYRLMSLTPENASKDILRTMQEGLLVVDTSGTIRMTNPSTQALLGYDEDELLGQPVKLLFPKECQVFGTGRAGGQDRSVHFEETTMIAKTQEGLPTLFSISVMRDQWGDSLGYVCTFRDITDRKMAEEVLRRSHDELERKVKERTEELAKVNEFLRAEIIERKRIQERIEHLAYHDHLTELPNRLLFTDRLEQAIRQARRAERPAAVMSLDLDAFKRVNDTMGHAQGDELLRKVSKRLKSTLRQSDTVARLGGDEFIILLQNLTDAAVVTRITDKILHSFDKPFKLEDQDFHMSAGLGVAIYPIDGLDADTLIKNADIAMYKAKEKGRNRCVFCSSLMKAEVMETMKLTNSLYRALERNELVLHYQPQVSCSTGRIVGVEALLRWHHPEMGMVSPGRFIRIAEQTGLILSIGDWVLRTACRQSVKWRERGVPRIRMAVNLSMYQFQSPSIVGEVAAILEETDMDPRQLEIEITESVLMKETEHMVEILTSLRGLGITIAIDDFGTEYSALNYLKQLPINRIKIAMPFVHGISVSDRDEAITKAIIVLASNLGLNVIAEGVETECQVRFLTQRMCDEIQGYYFHKPMPACEVEKVLAQQNR
jgi:diguanylate cyclase (GGDEF)-like protein/PAS domain S-box-containing protein